MDELEEMISENITLDSRVHARIIGARGKGIRKIMDEFKVSLARAFAVAPLIACKHILNWQNSYLRLRNITYTHCNINGF